jgi:aminopeptidase N
LSCKKSGGSILPHCDRTNLVDIGDGYSLLFLHSQHVHTPKDRSFTLPGDRVHYAPDRPADVRHVRLVVSLDFEQETVSGTVYTTFSALYEEVKTITFDAVELHIEQVALADGAKLAFTSTDKKLIVTLDRPYHHGETFTIAVTYHAKPRIGFHFIKPAPEDPTRPVQAWSFGQPRYHSRWFPCYDAPNDRATTEIIVTAPAQFLTISNGNLRSVIDNGETKTHHWQHDVPHATYLISLVVGEFAVIEDTYNGKPVTYYVRKGRKDDALLLMGKTPQMMRFFSDFTGVEYPYDKYAQTVVELYTGAMEHTTATTHSFALLPDQRAALDVDLVPVVAHELAHQWFGDLVTCRDWANGWLNEGFATYFEELWGEHDKGIDEFKYSMLQLRQGYLEEDSHYRRPIVYHTYYDDGFELFDGHMYNKGGWVLHMLRHQLSEAAFRRAIHTYLQRYRTKEVITADLERTLEEVTGRSLGQFFQQWVYSGGYPAFEVSYSWDSEQKMAKLKIKQAQKVDDLTPCFVTPVGLAFTLPVSDEAVQDAQTRTVPMRVIVGEDGQVEQSFYFPLEREPLMIRFDPDGWLLKTLKFERSTKMLCYQLAHDPDVLGRVEAAEALGEKQEPESFSALIDALNTDTFWGVRATVANALGKRGDAKAQEALIRALQELDPTDFSRVRAAIVSALGTFRAPQQAELAQRSAQVLQELLKKGDVSYRVEAAAATALGKTRTDNVEFLSGLLERPSWMNIVQRGIFVGLAATEDDRSVDIIASYLNNSQSHPTLRRVAAAGLWALGRNKDQFSEAARQRAVTALCNAVEHDSWPPVRAIAAMALMAFGERRALGPLESAASRELESSAQRQMRVAAHALRADGKDDEQIKNLRKDLDELREENRRLKDQLNGLEARLK